MNKERMHPGGMPESLDMRLWHPSGMRFLFVIISGGGARHASRNHRLRYGKPPACLGDLGGFGSFGGFAETALPKTGQSRNISYFTDVTRHVALAP
jgi:hypothetical protein